MDELNKYFRDLRVRLNHGMRSIRESLRGMGNSARGWFQQLRSSLSNGISSAGDLATNLLGKFDLNPYKLAADGIIAVGKAYWKAVKSAAAWDSEMLNVNKATKLGKQELATLSDEVKEIGAKNALPLEDAPKTFGKLVDAGLSAGDALKAFDPTLKAIKASGSDVDVVIEAVTETLKSGGVMDAKEAFDTMFATVNNGKASFDEIAKVLPVLAKEAQGAGLSFKNSAGMLAFLTQTGRDAESSAAILKKSLSGMSDPKFERYLQAIGLNAKDSAGRLRPMQDVIADLKGKFEGLNMEQIGHKLQKMGLNDAAANGISEMITKYDSLKKSIEACNESQGSLDKALAEAESPMDVWSVVANQLSLEMMELGKLALPFIKEMGVYVLQLVQSFKDWWNSSALLRDILGIVWDRFIWGLKIGFLPLMRIINLGKTLGNIFTWVAEQIGFSGTSIEGVYEKIRPYFLYIWALVSKIADVGFKVFSLEFSDAWDAIKNFKMPSLEFFIKKSDDDIKDHKAKIPGYGKVQKEAIHPAFRALTTDGYQFYPSPEDGKATSLVKKQEKKINNDNISAPVKSSIGNITGKAEQIKNLTINMDAMVKMGDFVSTNPEVSKMSKRELEQWFSELCVRMIRNMEMSYS